MRQFTAMLLVILMAALTAFSVHAEQNFSNGELTVDPLNAASGLLSVKGEPTNRRLKLCIQSGGVCYTYDLNQEGMFEDFPLQMGSGVYTVTLYKNSSATQYKAAGVVQLDVELADENEPFLHANQYVNYSEDSPAVQKSLELCAGLTDDAEKFNAIIQYMNNQHFRVDYVRALSVPSGTLPDVDETFRTGTGICHDLAAVVVCMLRVQGIPAKLMVGHAGAQYHAWVSAQVNGKEILFDPTAALCAAAMSFNYQVEMYF